MAEIRVNKVEAAKRQINTAIRLLFTNGDPIPIHTLASAGFRILRDIAKNNPKSHMAETMKKIIKTGMEREFWKVMHRPANFLKHANHDPDAILDGVQEEFNDGTLFLASLWYQDLGYQLTPEMDALVMWYTLLHPHLVNENKPMKSLLNLVEFRGLLNQTRTEKLEVGKLLLGIVQQQNSI